MPSGPPGSWNLREGDGGGFGGKEVHFLGLVLSELFALWTIKGSECDCSGLR